MQRQRNFRASLLILAAAFCNFLACDGHFSAGDELQSGGSVERAAPSQSGADSGGLANEEAQTFDTPPQVPTTECLAQDITIQEIAVYQGVKVPVARGLRALSERNADLVQNREALVRVFVEPGPSFAPRTLSALLVLQDEGEPARYFERTLTVSTASNDEDGSSTFNLTLPKDAFQESTQYAVELRETSGCAELAGTTSGARFPEQGLTPVRARATGPIKVMLVPVRYDADGSGRLPDVSAERLALMSERLYAMYPTSEVELTVHDVVGTERTELRDMLDQLRQLRAAEAPPSDLSYFGLVRQADTFTDYCQGACTTGIAGFGSQSGAGASGMGVGFPEAVVSTFVHELGHIYRRPHAPCGNPSAPDEAFPYPNATLGSWGYDLRTDALLAPATHADFMSYCGPDWISDFTYQQLLERIVTMNQRASFRLRPGEPSRYRTLLVEPAGQSRWGLDLTVSYGPPGDPVALEALDARGTLLETVSATLELQPDGGQAYFVPAGRAGWHTIRVPGGATLPYAEPTRNVPFQR